MTSELPPEFRPGSVLDGRFRMQALHGEGGMGWVVLADHIGLRVRVAIKVLMPQFARSSDVVTRFLREARAMARLGNEHVVNVMDVGTGPSGTPYFVMEYLDGADFSKLVAERGPLPIEDVIEYALQALVGIAAAHRAGVVHRDLKPSNLFLVKRADDFPLVKVLDFGISKHSTAEASSTVELTKPATMLGSPYYMSPEQLRDARGVDVRTDVWSFGVLLFELLTAELPFDGAIHALLIDAICSDEPRSIRELRPEVPPALAAVIGRCLEKEREHRFANVEELTRALAPLGTSAGCQVSVERILGRRSSAPPPPLLADSEPALASVFADRASNAPTLLGAAPHDTIATGPPTFSDVAAPNAGVAPATGSASRRARASWPWVAAGLAVGLAALWLAQALGARAGDGAEAASQPDMVPAPVATLAVAEPARTAAPPAPANESATAPASRAPAARAVPPRPALTGSVRARGSRVATPELAASVPPEPPPARAPQHRPRPLDPNPFPAE